MEFFRIKKDIPFMRHALVFNVISLITFLLAGFFLFNRGLHLSVEFTGGTLIEVSYAREGDKIIPTLRARAHMSAEATLLIEQDDPFGWGIQL